MKKTFLLLIALACLGIELPAQLRMPQLFSDHMVLQRDHEIPLWGWAKGRDKIEIQIGAEIYKTRAEKDGRWEINLSEMPAGGPYTLTVKTRREELVFEDILIGDVWICSGQSNMEWPLSSTNDAQAEIAAADHSQIR
ncbi:MAG: sialate O-acetylesterase, partial [Bacteroidota bacterium]